MLKNNSRSENSFVNRQKEFSLPGLVKKFCKTSLLPGLLFSNFLNGCPGQYKYFVLNNPIVLGYIL